MMNITNLGDLSHSYASRQRNTALRQDIDRLTTELATGQVANVRDVLDGNYSYLTDLERRSTLLEGYNVATTEATLYTAAVQTALGRVAEFTSLLGPSLLAAGTSPVGATGANIPAEARSALDGVLGALNTNAAGQFIFAGNATDTPPLVNSDALITDLRTALGGATTPQDILNAADAWFDDPAGFQAQIYQGSNTGRSATSLSTSDQIGLDLRATDPRLREVLKFAALAALSDDPALGLDVAARTELYDAAGQSLLLAQDDLTSLRADVGFVEARIEQVATRNAAEKTSLEFARAALLEVDPFEAATRLEEAQFQLQSLYSVTVRMSQLSLVNFL